MTLPKFQIGSSPKARRLLLRVTLIVSLALVPAEGSEIDDSDEATETVPEDSSAARFLAALEFRSVVSLPGGELFSLHDPHNERSFWIAPGEVRHGVEALAFEPDRQVLRVRYQGTERDIPLSRSRIRDVESTEDEDVGRLQKRWLERQEEWRGFQQRWNEAVEEFPEVRELQDHVREIIEEMRGLRESLAEADEDSPAYEEILDRQQVLAREYRRVEDYLHATVARHPAFEPEDLETVELLQQMTQHLWPELEVVE